MRRLSALTKGREPWVIGLALAAIAVLGLVFAALPALYHVPKDVAPPIGAPPAAIDPRTNPERHIAEVREREVRQRFDEAVLMLHAGKFEYAIAALHRVLELRPRMPEAHVNMGFALLGLREHAAARDFFLGAIALNARQANAYYGLAEAHEGLGELPEAMGAMRTYLHLAPATESHRGKAQAALWEWEAQRNRSAEPAAGGAPAATPARTAAAPGSGKGGAHE